MRSDAVCKGIRNIPGAGVEEVRDLAGAAQDREDTVLNAAAAILQAATPTAAMNALSGQLMSLFDLTWLAVADLGMESFVEVHGEVPTIAWVTAFATGLAERGRSLQRHHQLGGVRRGGARDRRSPSAAADRHRSAGASATASPCWSWSPPASSTPWGGASTPTERGGERRHEETGAGSRDSSTPSSAGRGLRGSSE